MRAPNKWQGTGAWFNARLGCLTASRMAEAIAMKKQTAADIKAGRAPEPMKCRQDLMFELLAERMTGNIVPHFVSDAMQCGTDHEPAAKMAYEGVTGNLVIDAPFVPHPTIEFCGASPDGYVDDGLIEIKCPTTARHLLYMRNKTMPDDYRPQILLQMACTRRRWCDFVSFDPRLPKAQQLFIVQYAPSEEEIERIEQQARDFLAELETLFEQITSGAAA